MSAIKFVVAAHVDHGKSTICGHLQVKVGMISDHELSELKKLSVTNKQKGGEYAYIGDVDNDEREKGISTDYNPVEFEYNGDKYCLVDNAGHLSFFRTVIAGFHHHSPKETIGCLVISLQDGEYEAGMGGGQTRENAKLLRGVGIDHLVVLMNKIDLVGVDTPRYKKIYGEVNKYVTRLGFKSIVFHPISGYRGDGLLELLGVLKGIHAEHIVPTLSITQVPTMIPKSETFPMIQIRIFTEEGFDKLITAGFSCILHCCKHEYQITIEKFKHYDLKSKTLSNKGAVAKNGDCIIAKLSSDQPFYYEDLDMSDKVILRKDDFTIAFGKIWVKSN